MALDAALYEAEIRYVRFLSLIEMHCRQTCSASELRRLRTIPNSQLHQLDNHIDAESLEGGVNVAEWFSLDTSSVRQIFWYTSGMLDTGRVDGNLSTSFEIVWDLFIHKTAVSERW